MGKIPESGIDSKLGLLVGVIAVAVPLLVAYLMVTTRVDGVEHNWIYALPHLNAGINGATSILLIMGLVFIKQKQITKHRNTMIGAFFLGSIFLVSYIIYHSAVPSTSFAGIGWIKVIYYSLLISHILLAIVVVPLVLLALYFALRGMVVKHRKIVKFAYPIWLYVSVSGVLVYLMISPYY